MLNAVVKVKTGDWLLLKKDAMLIREQVFIQEQDIPAEEEWDDLDAVAEHFVLYVENQAAATARLLPNHSIGRVAVLQKYRGQSYGKAIMQEVIRVTKAQQRAFVRLSSQVHAIGFYQALGFTTEGDEYLDCGIPHITMTLQF